MGSRKPLSSPFRFVLVRGPVDTHAQAPLGLVYRARAHGELVWVLSLSPPAEGQGEPVPHHSAAGERDMGRWRRDAAICPYPVS